MEAAAARQEAARRRWAVDKLHSAYAKRWRFEVSARRERRRKLEEEEDEEEDGERANLRMHLSEVCVLCVFACDCVFFCVVVLVVYSYHA